MKRVFPFAVAAVTFICGLIIRFSFVLSDHAAWSYIISSVNLSPWELFKPFGFVWIGMIPIELSVLRPRLLRFICDKILGLMLLCGLLLSVGLVSGSRGWSEMLVDGAALFCITAAEVISCGMYRKSIRTELLAVPLICVLCSFVMLLIIMSFYPPHFPVFYDKINGIYGRTIEFDVLECYRRFISDTIL